MSDDFTLVTWNIFQGLHHSSSRRRLRPNPAIEEELASLDADVLVLPEAWKIREPEATWAEDIAARLGYELHQWVSDRPSRPRERTKWRMAIMTRVPCRRLEDHVMPQFNHFAPRAFVCVELESGVKIAGTHLYGIHMLGRASIRGFQGERQQVRKVAADFDVIAGDMNIWGPFVRRDMPALRPALRARTFPTTHPHSQIDHVMVSDRIEVVDAALLPRMGSDHIGIRTTLALR